MSTGNRPVFRATSNTVLQRFYDTAGGPAPKPQQSLGFLDEFIFTRFAVASPRQTVYWHLYQASSKADLRMRNTIHSSRLKAYLEPRTLLMLTLGFSSGLPFLLVGNTFGYWLRDEGVTLTAIGLLSGVGLAYSLKFLWAPLIDRVRAPLFGRLGRRRGWMALSQILIALGLFAMAAAGLKYGPTVLGACALVVAFSAATQDIVIDAWRIETAKTSDELGLLTSAATFGYRIALLGTDAIILIIADKIGWQASYVLYGALMAVGLTATCCAAESKTADAALDAKEPLWSPKGLFDAIAGPFIAFFKTHGWLALLMLSAIALYRLPDFVMGPMCNPFYHDLGLTKTLVGEVRGTVGLIASFLGIAAGGFTVLRFGNIRALVVGGVLQAVSIAAFALLAYWGSSLQIFAAVMAGDSFATSFAGVVLVAYMSSLTSLGYTATQYALLASAYAMAGKLLKTLSGLAIDTLKTSHGLMDAYATFFLFAGAIGLPAICLFLVLAHRLKLRAARK
jgi:MFS transporter, PAT family, beta-lactamase induction signal transducer AmpG